MTRFALILMFPLCAAGTCIQVDGDRVLAGDLASRFPSFASIPANTAVGFTPLPGTSRVLTIRELSSFASRHGIPATTVPQDVCIERAGLPLSPAALLNAMKKALNVENAQIDLIDYSKQVLPSGNLEFLRANLAPPPASNPLQPVVWRGRLTYGGHESISIWARVRISVLSVEYVVTRELRPGIPIVQEDIREVRAPRFPGLAPTIGSIGEVVGRSVRRTMRAGDVLRPSMLVTLPEVRRGDTVTVIIQSGAARLELSALAQSSGRTGDVICLRNPENQRQFRGTVEGKGRALVVQPEETRHVVDNHS